MQTFQRITIFLVAIYAVLSVIAIPLDANVQVCHQQSAGWHSPHRSDSDVMITSKTLTIDLLAVALGQSQSAMFCRIYCTMSLMLSSRLAVHAPLLGTAFPDTDMGRSDLFSDS